MTKLSAHEILDRVFRTIVRTAERDPVFAQELAQVLCGRPPGNLSDRQKPALRRLFDPSDFHAINILRAHGEDALRGKLEQIRATADLRSVVAFSGLILSGRATSTRATREDLINGIVAAAKHYIAQRDAGSS
jgi:hypothetical protein